MDQVNNNINNDTTATLRAYPCLRCLKSAMANKSYGDCLDDPSSKADLDVVVNYHDDDGHVPVDCLRCQGQRKGRCEDVPESIREDAAEFVRLIRDDAFQRPEQ